MRSFKLSGTLSLPPYRALSFRLTLWRATSLARFHPLALCPSLLSSPPSYSPDAPLSALSPPLFRELRSPFLPPRILHPPDLIFSLSPRARRLFWPSEIAIHATDLHFSANVSHSLVILVARSFPRAFCSSVIEILHCRESLSPACRCRAESLVGTARVTRAGETRTDSQLSSGDSPLFLH